MSSFNFVLWVIIGCGLVTWLSRVLPFILLKKFDLPKSVINFLKFVPIVIMSPIYWLQFQQLLQPFGPKV